MGQMAIPILVLALSSGSIRRHPVHIENKRDFELAEYDDETMSNDYFQSFRSTLAEIDVVLTSRNAGSKFALLQTCKLWVQTFRHT